MTNYAPPQENGHSVAFTPVAFDESGSAVDSCIVEEPFIRADARR